MKQKTNNKHQKQKKKNRNYQVNPSFCFKMFLEFLL